MKKLIIIGAGNVGGFLSYNIDEFGEYDVLGFLDDDETKIGKSLYGRKVLGTIDTIKEYLKEVELNVVIGIASPASRAHIVERLNGYRLIYPNFIAKNVWLSKKVNIGKGIILYPGVSINYETTIMDFVIMNMNCAIGHNCTIEPFVSLAPGVNLGGYTYVEKRASLGIGVSTRQNIRIGETSVIGGQCMVIRNIDPNTKVAGVPGKALNR